MMAMQKYALFALLTRGYIFLHIASNVERGAKNLSKLYNQNAFLMTHMNDNRSELDLDPI